MLVKRTRAQPNEQNHTVRRTYCFLTQIKSIRKNTMPLTLYICEDGPRQW